MIFLWNPTKEPIHYQYGGLSYTIPPESRKKVEEAEGKHVLNQLGQKGLTRLDFDDEGRSVNEDKIKEDALDRNKQFKIRQIMVYNERNERRKASGQPYDTPTREVRQYAAELGIELLQGYTMAEAEKGQIAKLTQENDTLKAEISNMTKQFQEVMEMMKSEQEARNKAAEVAELEGGMVVCPLCNETVMKTRLAVHMANKHVSGRR